MVNVVFFFTVKGIRSRKISMQFGLLPINSVWEMVESPSMLIPSNPAPVELLMVTLEMVTLTVCRKHKVALDIRRSSFSKSCGTVKFEVKGAPQKVKRSFAIFRVVTFMNMNPNDFEQLITESLLA